MKENKMKNISPLLLPLLVFIACSDDDEKVDACNTVVDSLNEAQTAWVAVDSAYQSSGEYVDGAADLCNDYYDALILIIEEDCPNDLGPYEGWTTAQVEETKAIVCDL
tara:strand:- start:215 stop:538 length:324 start_codon:yes stop_codon:yes gene_type:complete